MTKEIKIMSQIVETLTPKKAANSKRMRIIHVIFAMLFLFSVPVYSQVPVSISPAPRLQFLDANGHPLAGGCVFTYQAGTSTPLATYIDSGGVFQNANPTILDAGGFASIWLTNVAYDIAVFSTGGVNCATGAQQYKTLNINSNTALLNAPNVWSGLQTFNGGLTGTGSTGTLTAGPGLTATQNNWTASQLFFRLITNQTNPALAGSLSLTNGDTINWRNAANSGDLTLTTSGIGSASIPADALTGTFTAANFPFFIANNPSAAASGQLRLGAGESVCWRNQANTGDVCITKNAADSIIAPGLGGVKKECANVTPVTVGNTVTPTNLQTCTIPAGDIASQSEFSLDAQGIIGATGTPTVTIAVMLDGVNIGQILLTLSAANTQPFSAHVWFVGVSTGVTGSITGAPLLWQSTVSAGGGTALVVSNSSGVGSPPQFVTIDTTISHVISLQVTWGAAAALNTITSNAMVVSRLN